MKNTKLIFVAGMSGAGKSTTAQRISKQLTNNKIKHVWLHEEVANHPIRSGEFKHGNHQVEEDMDTNCEIMVKKWEKLAESILESNQPYVMEGCLYQSIIRYFLDANYPVEKITAYYDRVMEAIKPLNPVLVFLRPKDVRGALENAFPTRGDWWKELILKPETDGYFKFNQYLGEESIYKMWEHYQSISDIQFERYDGWKIRIDTTSGDWVNHLKDIMELIGISYQDETARWVPESLNSYCGLYEVTTKGRTIRIKVFEEGHKLYCKSSWPYMLLSPKVENRFEMASFPIEFFFHKVNGEYLISVTGSYPWDIVGETLTRVN